MNPSATWRTNPPHGTQETRALARLYGPKTGTAFRAQNNDGPVVNQELKTRGHSGGANTPKSAEVARQGRARKFHTQRCDSTINLGPMHPSPPTALPQQGVAHYHVAATQHAQPCARANATSTGAIAIQRSACVPSRQAQLPATRRRCSCTRCSGNQQRASAMPTTTTHCSARNEPRNASAPLSTRQLCWGPNRAKCTELR